MGPKAAVVGTMHTCPMVTGLVPHVGGPIIPPCSPTVKIEKRAAARKTDRAQCAAGPPDVIMKGSMTVKIEKLAAARVLDITAHGGAISALLASLTVNIGG
jgi:uncharacterized Zn-binding protein involved in type VI secretion